MEGRVLRRAAHLLGLGLLAGAHASTMRVLLPDGRNLTLPATHTASSPALPALSPMAAPLALLFAGDACAPLAPDVPRPAIGGFVLFARRGGCVFDVKMQTAMAAGAAALVVGDTLAAEYAALSDATAQSAALTNPCIVSCTVGRGVVDASTLSLADVLGGLPSSCPAPAEYTGRRCPTNLCAFSGHAPNGSGSGGGGGGGGGDSSGGAGAQAPLLAPPPALREVCCVLDSLGWSSCMHVLTTAPLPPPQVCCVLDSPAFEMALPNTSGAGHSTAVPALYLPLALGQLLEAQCDPHARATSPHARATSPHARATSSVGGGTATPGTADHGRWDSSVPGTADHGMAPALSACSALLYEEEVPVGHGRWDSSAPLIWLLATRCDAR